MLALFPPETRQNRRDR